MSKDKEDKDNAYKKWKIAEKNTKKEARKDYFKNIIEGTKETINKSKNLVKDNFRIQ